MDIETMLAQYIATALWSTTDNATDNGGEPLDANYDETDLAPEARASMAKDCADFAAYCARVGVDLSTFEAGRVGHDFWLTRNGHGAGFWDGDYPEPQATQLTNASKTFGESDIYVGDDGTLYVSP